MSNQSSLRVRPSPRTLINTPVFARKLLAYKVWRTRQKPNTPRRIRYYCTLRLSGRLRGISVYSVRSTVCDYTVVRGQLFQFNLVFREAQDKKSYRLDTDKKKHKHDAIALQKSVSKTYHDRTFFPVLSPKTIFYDGVLRSSVNRICLRSELKDIEFIKRRN